MIVADSNFFKRWKIKQSSIEHGWSRWNHGPKEYQQPKQYPDTFQFQDCYASKKDTNPVMNKF